MSQEMIVEMLIVKETVKDVKHLAEDA